jgi:hypothetical protein
MTDGTTINDYAMLDQFLSDSVQSYRRQVFGGYDERTGYFEQERLDDEPVVEQSLSEDAEELATDPVNPMGITEDEAMFDYLFGEPGYVPQRNNDEDFYTYDSDEESEPVEEAMPSNLVQPGVGAGAFQFKPGVSNEGLQSNVQGLINELSKVAGDFVITSGKRSQSENARLKGSARKSFHLSGEAVDIRPNENIDKFLSSQQGKKYLADRGFEAVDERGKKGAAHWHIEPVNRQAGGSVPIARTKQQQVIGLNNDALDELILPLSGTNTIRGLDSGHPVMVQDENGNTKVLYGPKHTTRMKGRVFERKLK